MYFFLTDTCKGIIKSSGVRKFCPSSKFPNKSSAGLTRFDCKLDSGYSMGSLRFFFGTCAGKIISSK